MTDRKQSRPSRPRTGRWGVTLGLALALGAAGCDGLLEVELPDTVTGDALEDPATAQLQLNGLMGQIECGLSSLHYHAGGYEGVFRRVAGAYGNYSEFAAAPTLGNCDADDDGNIQNLDFDWYEPLQTGRASAFQLYDRIQNQWAPESVANRDQILAQTALYAAISLEVLGDFFCEMSIDEGELLNPTQTLDMAELWAGRALEHIAVTGDFELPNGVTGTNDGQGILPLAHAIRARIRWMNGNDAGALADLAEVPAGFTAYITREPRQYRQNKVFFHQDPGGGLVSGPIDEQIWNDPEPSHPGFFEPVYADGEPGWPAVIPFTGYLNLGILPDGRAVVNDGGLPYPVTTDAAGAVDDNRVETQLQAPSGSQSLHPVPAKYESYGDEMPLVSWRELKLIEAELEPGSAVANVNEIRAFHGLPLVTYNPATPDEIENMIIEERRRELWLEGRYWATKIRHPEKLWFPRNWGTWPPPLTEELGGGVRLAMPRDEYEINPNFTLGDRATGCSAETAPILVG